MDEFVELTGDDLEHLLELLDRREQRVSDSIRKVRIYFTGKAVKVKVNEFSWSPSLGRVQKAQ